MTTYRISSLALAAAAALLLHLPALGQGIRLESALLHEYEVVADGQYKGQITITNTSNEQKYVKVYQVDYFREKPEGIRFTLPGKQPHDRSNLSWIQFPTSIVAIGPHERQRIEYTILVPSASALEHLNGTYWSSVMVEEELLAQPMASANDSKYSFSLRPKFRTGTLIATHFPLRGASELTFSSIEIKEEAGVPRLVFNLRNSGPGALNPKKVWVELYDAAGNKVVERETDEATPIMLPNNIYKRSIGLGNNRLRPGAYRCLVVVDAGRAELYGAHTTLYVPVL